MSILNMLLSPLNLLFFILIFGLAVGQIRICNISLGIAGVLFVSIFVGIGIRLFGAEVSADNIQSTMKIFSSLGSSLFVSVIGLQTGFSLKNSSKGSIAAFFAGILMSLSGVMAMLLISALDKTVAYPMMLGILCGALTSTPGLSAVCELVGSDSNSVIIGYGCSYFCGVLLVVVLSQAFMRKRDKLPAVAQFKNEHSNKAYSELIMISITALLGNMGEGICASIWGIPIGSTALTLLFGLIVGVIGKTAKVSSPSTVLVSLKNLGLSLFFAGTGFAAGTNFVRFDIKIILYGALITLAVIACGMVFSKLIFTRSSLDAGFVIAGGMTSSPAYGAISDYTREDSLNHFSFSYFGALIALVAVLQILV